MEESPNVDSPISDFPPCDIVNSNPIPIGLGISMLEENVPHQIFMWDTKQNFQSYGYRVRN